MGMFILRRQFILVWVATSIFMRLAVAQTSTELAPPTGGADKESDQVPQVPVFTTQSILMGRIQNLEEQITQLKTEIATSETELMRLKTQVGLTENTEVRLFIQGREKINDQYVLLQSVYYLDGKKIAEQNEEDHKIPVYSGLISEGNHVIEVEKLYKRTGKIGATEGQTFRLKNSTSLFAALGRIVHVDAITIEKDRRSQEKLAIHFDVKVELDEKSENVPVSVLEVLTPERSNLSPKTYLTIMVKENFNPSLRLEKQTIFIDEQNVQPMEPLLVTERGNLIYEGLVTPGEHIVNSVLQYHVSGELADLLKTKQLKLKFSNKVSVKLGYKATLYLQGYEKGTTVGLPEGESVGLAELVEELIREQQLPVESEKVSNHG